MAGVGADLTWMPQMEQTAAEQLQEHRRIDKNSLGYTVEMNTRDCIYFSVTLPTRQEGRRSKFCLSLAHLLVDTRTHFTEGDYPEYTE